MFKQLFFVTLLTTLTACGGGSYGGSDTGTGGNTGAGGSTGGSGGNTGTGGNTGAGGNTGSGNETGDSARISTLRPIKYTVKWTSYYNGAVTPSPSQTVEVLAISNNSNTAKITFENNSNVLTGTSTTTVQGNYRYTTMSYSEEVNAAGNVVMTQTVNSNPATRSPYGRVSKNQQWIDTYNVRTDLIINGVQQPQQNSTVTSTNTILEVNVSKTVEAGEFNTFIVSYEGESTKQVFWIDLETSAPVYTQIYLSGVLTGVGELVELN